MTDEIFFDGVRYISAAEAAGLSNLTRDYVARLGREGKIVGKQIGRQWYVSHESLRTFLVGQEYSNALRQKALVRERQQEYARTQLPIASPKSLPQAIAPAALAAIPVVQNELHKKLANAVAHTSAQAVSKATAFAGNTSAQMPLYAVTPGFELLHKIAAAILAITLVVGVYSAGNSLTSTSPDLAAGTVVTPSIELGATAGLVAGTFSDIAQGIENGIDEFFSPFFGVHLATNNGAGGFVSVQITQTPTKPRPLAPIVASVQPAQTISQTIIQNPVIERVVDSERVIASGGITQDELNQQLQQLDNKLSEQMFSLTSANSTAIAQNYNVTAQTNAIDALSNTTITNASITGGSISSASISGGTISGATISGATFSGTTTLDALAVATSATSTFAGGIDIASGCFSVAGTCITAGGGGAGNPGGSNMEVQFNDGGVFNGTSALTLDKTTGTLSVSILNASSTVTGNLTAGNATTTNATTTNLYVSGNTTLANPLAPSSGGTGTSSAPSYGQVLLGNSSGGYDLVSTSSLGIVGGGGGGGTWGSITGVLSNQTDLQNALNAKFSLSDWYATTTNALAEGSNNLYFTTGRVQSYLDTLNKGYFFATSSASYFLSQNQASAFSTSSASYFLGQNQSLAFSTSSASYFLAQNGGAAFATSSSDFWLSTKTTSNLAEGTNLYYTDARVNSFIAASTTIPKTYANNTFTGNTSFTNATTSNLFSTTASSTNLFSQTASFGSLNLISALPIASGGTNATSFTTGQLLAYNGTSFVSSSTIGNGELQNSALSVSAGSGLSGGGSVSLGGTTSLSLNLANANSWTGLQQFTNSSSTFATLGTTWFSGITSSLLKTDANGKLVAAVAGTDYENPLTFSTGLNRSGNTITNTGVLSVAGTTNQITANTSSGVVTLSLPTLVNFTNASTTNLSVFSTAYFGSSATSTFDSAGDLSVAGTLNATGQATLGNASTSVLSVSGASYLATAHANALSLGSVVSCTGGQALQTDGSGNISCGVIASGGASSGGGWTESSDHVGLSTTTDLVAIGATSTPYAKFAILSGSAATTTLALVPANSQTANIIDIYNTSGGLGSVLTAGGNLGLGTTTPGSLLSLGGIANFTTATSTFYGSGGINLTAGCFAIGGTCLTQNPGTVTSVVAGTGLTGGTITNSGTIALDLTNANSWTGLQQFTNSSSTFATLGTTWFSGITSSLLKTDANGKLVAAVAGTDYVTPGGLAATYPFPLTGNATSTLTQFNGGLTAFASSTIGNGSAALTINGNATTTGNFLVNGGIGIGVANTSAGTLQTSGNVTAGGEVFVGSGASTQLFGGGLEFPLSGGAVSVTFAGSGNGGNLDIGAGGTASNNPGGSLFLHPGSGLAGTGNVLIGFDSSGGQYAAKTGIGTSSPYAELSVAGLAGSATPLLAISSSTSAYATTTVFAIDKNGNTTIGNNGSVLSINGATTTASNGINLAAGCFAIGGNCLTLGSFSGTLAIANGGTNATSFTTGAPIAFDGTRLVSSSTLSVVYGGTGSTTLSGLLKGNGTSGIQSAIAGIDYQAPITGSTGQIAYFSGTNTPVGTSSVFISSNGNIGIGTTTSTATFTITGPDTVTGQKTFAVYGQNNVAGAAGEGSGIYLASGNGGSSGFSSSFPGGDGGNLELYAGTGGAQSIGNRAGDGGSVFIAGGPTGSGAVPGKTGSVILGVNAGSGAVGNVGIATSTPGSLFSINNIANFTTATTTFYSTGGINLAAGCFAIGGNCLTLGSFSGTLPIASGGTNATSFTTGQLLAYNGTSFVSSSTIGNGELQNSALTVSAGSGLSGGGSVSLGGTTSLSLNLTNANSWTGLQTFANASSTLETDSTLWLPNISAGSLLKTNAQGQVAAAVAGTDYQAPITATYPLQFSANNLSTAFGTTTTNTFSQLQTFTSGVISNASSTVAGNFNTTGTSYFGGNVGIGTSTPFEQLTVLPTSTTMSMASSTSSGLNNPSAVYIQGRYAYVVSQDGVTNSSVSIFDVSNPASPTKVGSVSIGLQNPDSIYVQGRYAYVGSLSNFALVVFDVSNPAAPFKIGAVGLSSFPNHVYVQGRYAYVTTSTTNPSLSTVDISNPASLIKVSSISTGLSTPSGVYVSGRYAYVTDSTNGLVVFDISDPVSPVEVGSTATGLSSPNGIYVSGRYAYVTDSTNGLITFDISNPASPAEVGSTTSGLSTAESVSVQGRYAYVGSNGNNSLVTFDISNPASLVKVATISSGLSGPQGIYVSGRYAYVASNTNNSLVTFDLGGAYVQSLEAGTLEAGTLSLRNNLSAVDGAFSGGLTVGNNVNVAGSFGLTASTFNATTTAGQNYSIFSLNTASSTSPLFTALYNGNVGIGTSTPGANFSINGTTGENLFQIATSTNQSIFTVDQNGNITVAGALNVTGNSTFSNATTTNLFSTTASSTNLFAQTASLGSLSLINALTVPNGGTGATSLTGLIKGNGTSAFTAATAGTDFVAPGTTITAGAGLTGGGDLSTNRTISLDLTHANSWTGLQTFQNASSTNFSVFGTAFFGGSATTTIDSAGNVAVAGTLNVTGNTTLANATSTTFFSTTASSTNLFSLSASVGTLTSAGNIFAPTFFVTSGSNGIILNSSGLGGVAVDNPGATVSVFGGDAFSTGNNGGSVYLYGGLGNSAANGNIILGSNSSGSRRGNVGIGATSTPFAELSLAGSAGATLPLVSISTSTSAFATTTIFAIDKNGNTTIGNNGSVLTINGATTTAANGINLTTGCFAIGGNCLTLGSFSGTLAIANGGTNATSFTTGAPIAFDGTRFVSSSTLSVAYGGTGANTLTSGQLLLGNGTAAVSSVARGSLNVNAGLTISNNANVLVGQTATISLDLTNPNSWTGLQTFQNASSSQLSVFTKAYFGSTATSTFDSAGNLSVAGTLNVTGNTTLANATSTTLFSTTASSTNLFAQTASLGSLTVGSATSTFGNGINLTTGCFAVGGTCIGGASGSGTVNTGTQGQFAFYAAGGTTVSGTSTLFATTAGNIGIGTTTPGLVSGASKYLTLATSGTNPSFSSLELSGFDSNVSNSTIGRIDFFNAANVTDLARISTAISNDVGQGALVFSTNAGSGLGEVARITSTGNFGLGTSTPGANLTVNGTTGQNLLQIATSTNQNIFTIDQNGNVAAAALSLVNALPVASGGTGATSLTGILKGNGTGAFTAVTGTNNYLPKWSSNSLTGTSLLFDTGSELRIGTTTNILGNSSRVFIFGGSNGANIDVMGDATIVGGDQAVFEAEGSDYSGSNKSSLALQYYGPGGLGTTTGFANKRLGILDFGSASTSIISTGINQIGANSDLIFANGYVQHAVLTGAGNFGLNNTAPVNTLDIINSPSGTSGNAGFGLLAAPVIGNVSDNAFTINAATSTFSPSGVFSKSAASVTNIALNAAKGNFSLSGITLGNLVTGGRDLVTANANLFSLTGSPTFNDTSGASGGSTLNNLFANGINASVSLTPVNTAGLKNRLFSAAGNFSEGSTETGLVGATTYGIEAVNNSNLESPNSIAYGGSFSNTAVASTTYGIFASDNSSAIGNTAYGLYLSGPGTTNPNDYSLYSAGSAPSYFQGNVGVGTTTPWGKLAISTAIQQDGSIPLFNIASTTNASLFTVLGNGNVGIGTSTPGSLLSLGGIANFTTATSSFYGTGGINLTSGCFSIGGNCLGAGGSGTVTSIIAGTGLTGGTITTSGTIALDLTHPNNWTGLQTFQNASSTNFSVFTNAYFGGSATSSFNSAGTLTLAGLTNSLLYTNGSNQVAAVSVSSPLSFSSGTLSLNTVGVGTGGTGATSLTGLLQGNGTSPITGVTGTAGQFVYFNGTNTVTATSTLFLATSGNIGIGTTNPINLFTVAGAGSVPTIVASTTDVTSNSQANVEDITDSSSFILKDNGSLHAVARWGLASVAGWNELLSLSNTGTNNGLAVGTLSAVPVIFGTNSLERLRITGSGNVGIGTTSPQTTLEVSNSSAATTTPLFISNYGFATSSTDVGLAFRTDDITHTTGTTTSAITSILQKNFAAGQGDLAFSVLNAGALTEAMRIANTGRVGVGTTTPNTTLAVSQTVTTPQFSIAYDNSHDTEMRVDSAGGLNVHASGNQDYFVNDNLWVCTGGTITASACPTGNPTGQGNLVVANKAGIGTSTPASLLDIYGSGPSIRVEDSGTAGNVALFQASASTGPTLESLTDGSGNSTSNSVATQITFNTTGFAVGTSPATAVGSARTFSNQLTLNTSGNLLLGTSTAQVTGETVQNKLFVANGYPSAMGLATSTIIGDLKVTGKLDVPTIDPVYTIGGTKYATYGESSTGEHEETLQTIELTQKDPSTGKYVYPIHFDTLDEGSDLWLFYQITDFGDNWQNLVVELTPGFDGTVFYQKEPNSDTLLVESDAPGEVSMRLSGDRFDYSKWGNVRPDQNDTSYPGFVLPIKDDSQAAAAASAVTAEQ